MKPRHGFSLEDADFLPIISVLLLIIENGKSAIPQSEYKIYKKTLIEVLKRSSKTQHKAINDVIKKINSDPRLRIAFLQNLRSRKFLYNNRFEGMVNTLIEESAEFTPDLELRVCPIDPTHYRIKKTSDTKELSCPLHEVLLVSESNSANILTSDEK